jgi:hypothetical protein
MSMTPWRPSKPVAYLIAMFTLWPPLYFVFFLCFMAFAFASVADKASPHVGVFPFQYIFVMHLATMLFMFALTGVYLVHVFRTDQLASDRRIMWTVVLVFFNMFAFPVYWWFYIRPHSDTATGSPDSSA